MKLRKIISGGQTGADRGGLHAGRALGLETGGTAPPNFMTAEGPNPSVLMAFGLVEGSPDPSIYRLRTEKNVINADATLWMGSPTSPGGRLTLGTCRKLSKPVIVNPTPKELRDFLEKHNTTTLNVAGNREHTNPGIQRRTMNLLIGAVGEHP